MERVLCPRGVYTTPNPALASEIDVLQHPFWTCYKYMCRVVHVAPIDCFVT